MTAKSGWAAWSDRRQSRTPLAQVGRKDDFNGEGNGAAAAKATVATSSKIEKAGAGLGGQVENFWARGKRRPTLKALLVSFRPGGACLRLYSFWSTRSATERTRSRGKS